MDDVVYDGEPTLSLGLAIPNKHRLDGCMLSPRQSRHHRYNNDNDNLVPESATVP